MKKLRLYEVLSIAVVALLAASCGTRVDSKSTETGSLARSEPSPSGVAVAATPDGRVEASRQTAPAASGASSIAAPSSAKEAVPASTTTSLAPSPGNSASPDRKDSLPQSSSDRGAREPAVPATGDPARSPLSPLIVASVGTYSGPVGAVFGVMAQAAQVWVSWTNGRGGVHGHPVKLYVYDDGGDPARSKAQVVEAVERRGVIAFVQQGTVVTGESSLEYIKSKRIPVIGTDTGPTWVYENPMYFPQTSSAGAMDAATMYASAQRLIPQGKRKLGWVICVEATACDRVANVWADAGPRVGFQIAYRGRISVAQPDYTAECLSARNAGVEVLAIAADANSIARVAQSCSRQGYRPTYTIVSGTVAEHLQDDPNFNGLVAPTTIFPWFQSGTPVLDEFQSAMRHYGAGIPRGAGPAAGWVSAKLLERAAATVSEPPTSESLLQALWNLRGDDLGGITQPLSFVKDQPAKPLTCYWVIEVRNGSWGASPGGEQRRCV